MGSPKTKGIGCGKNTGCCHQTKRSDHRSQNEQFNKSRDYRYCMGFDKRHKCKRSEDYKQHNPYVADGKKPFVSYFKGFFKENPQSRARIIRSAVDGDLVWVQVHSTKNPADRGEAVVDIFRVQNGKIVEHWDVIQEIPEESANRNTMF